MLKHLICLIFITSCTTLRNHRDPMDDEVTVRSDLEDAQMSYMKGCVDAWNSMNVSPVFEKCRELARAHRKEILETLGIKDSSSSSDQPKP